MCSKWTSVSVSTCSWSKCVRVREGGYLVMLSHSPPTMINAVMSAAAPKPLQNTTSTPRCITPSNLFRCETESIHPSFTTAQGENTDMSGLCWARHTKKRQAFEGCGGGLGVCRAQHRPELCVCSPCGVVKEERCYRCRQR